MSRASSYPYEQEGESGEMVHGIPVMPFEIQAKRSKEGWELLSDSIKVVLTKWNTLATAVDQEVRIFILMLHLRQWNSDFFKCILQWGGKNSLHKYNELVEDLLANLKEQWNLGNDIHIDTLDVFFLEALESDFNFEYEEDDSEVTHFGMLIKDLYKKSMNQEFDAVHQIVSTLEKHPAITSQRVQDSDDESDEGSDEEEETEPVPAPPKKDKPVADAEGWFTVPTKKGKPKPAEPEPKDDMNVD